MTWLLSAAGTAVVLFVLRDIFHTLWHPQGFGSLARMVVRLTWWISKVLTRRRGSELAGPLSVLSTVAVWTLLNVIGWALIYLPWMPDGFYFGTSLEPVAASDELTSLYLSLVTLATLGFGDITPATPALRLIVPAQALVGFILLTAAISWMLQIYPALGRRRAIASELHVLSATDAVNLVENGVPSVAAPLLQSLTRSLLSTTVDLTQYAESYYFWEREESQSLAASLPLVVRLIEASERSPHSEVSQSGASLDRAAAGLADELSGFVDRAGAGDSMSDVFAAYARDHGKCLSDGLR